MPVLAIDPDRALSLQRLLTADLPEFTIEGVNLEPLHKLIDPPSFCFDILRFNAGDSSANGRS
jgi:hypothetical protein